MIDDKMPDLKGGSAAAYCNRVSLFVDSCCKFFIRFSYRRIIHCEIVYNKINDNRDLQHCSGRFTPDPDPLFVQATPDKSGFEY